MKSQCAKCYKEFIFAKDEWKYWIDELGFYFQATKKYCENCNPNEKLKKSLSKKITEQRKLEFGEKYVELTIEISEIYNKLELKNKGKGFLKVIINDFKEEYNIKLKEKIKTEYSKL